MALNPVETSRRGRGLKVYPNRLQSQHGVTPREERRVKIEGEKDDHLGSSRYGSLVRLRPRGIMSRKGLLT